MVLGISVCVLSLLLDKQWETRTEGLLGENEVSLGMKMSAGFLQDRVWFDAASLYRLVMLGH